MQTNQRENPMLNAALDYASKGIPVFPLHTPRLDGSCSCGRKDCNNTGKHPRTANGVKDATTDEAQIRKWWTENPDANIGKATGTESAPIVVVDVDCDHERGKFGDESLAELEAEHGQLPDTWVCNTGGGGYHYYFYCNDPTIKNSVNLCPGLDVRAAGGYVVAPPSLHKSGRQYEWDAGFDPEDEPFPAVMPDWLHGLMCKSKTAQGIKVSYEAPEHIQDGSRNDTLFRLASSLRTKGLTTEEIEAAVLKMNEKRCDPPLSENEVRTICGSVGKYERGDFQITDTVKPPDYSDAGNSEVFTRIYEKDLIFTDALGWLYWNGKQWERNDHNAMEYAKALSQEMLSDALNLLSDAMHKEADAKTKFEASEKTETDKDAVKQAMEEVKRAKAYVSHAKTTRNAPRLKAMLELSKSNLVIKADKLDANAFDLNTPNGIVNLLTGEVRPHDRTAYCSQITMSSPSNDGAEMWDDFLNTVTCNNENIKGYLQQVAGMAAVGAVYQEGIVIAHGGGRNGKSTFFNALGSVFGTYSGGIDVKVMTTDRQNKGASLATLRGKRLVVTGELEEHQRLSVATLKQLASTDMLTIEEKFKAPETVKQTHTLVLFTNHLPRVGSTDGGTWRRLNVVPFNATIPSGAGIQNYADMLAEKAGGAILSWIVQGAVMFAKNGFKVIAPDEIQAATEAYRLREDWLSNFIEDCCKRDPNARAGSSELYKVYKSWAEERKEYVRRMNEFNDAMEAAGFKKIAPKNKRTWLGVKTAFSNVHGGVAASGF